MSDLIRKSDALAAAKGFIGAETAIAALPAVTVGVKPLVWEGHSDHVRAGDHGVMPTYGQGPKDFLMYRGSNGLGYFDTIAAAKAAAQADYEARILAALEPVAAPDTAAIREAWEKAYWRMRSYAVHDNDCKLNKPPHFNGPCSCGLTATLEEALALIPKGAADDRA